LPWTWGRASPRLPARRSGLGTTCSLWHSEGPWAFGGRGEARGQQRSQVGAGSVAVTGSGSSRGNVADPGHLGEV
jgi:hypothetical protein